MSKRRELDGSSKPRSASPMASRSSTDRPRTGIVEARTLAGGSKSKRRLTPSVVAGLRAIEGALRGLDARLECLGVLRNPHLRHDHAGLR